MGVACDMKNPIGYWVQQVRANGETVAVKVLHAAACSCSRNERGATSRNRRARVGRVRAVEDVMV